MNPMIPLSVAFVFSSLCFGGMVVLIFITAVMRRNHGGVDATDGFLVTFYCLLLSIAGLMVLAASIFGEFLLR